MVNTATDHARLAAEMTGIDPEQFALGQVHFHALRVADPQDPDRAFHVTRLLEAASTTADFIVPRQDDDEDEDEEEEIIHPDLPPAPVSDEPQTPESRKKWGMEYLQKILASVK